MQMKQMHMFHIQRILITLLVIFSCHVITKPNPIANLLTTYISWLRDMKM
jgi:hypothetical protein